MPLVSAPRRVSEGLLGRERLGTLAAVVADEDLFRLVLPHSKYVYTCVHGGAGCAGVDVSVPLFTSGIGASSLSHVGVRARGQADSAEP